MLNPLHRSNPAHAVYIAHQMCHSHEKTPPSSLYYACMDCHPGVVTQGQQHVYNTKYKKFEWIHVLRDKHEGTSTKKILTALKKGNVLGAVVYHEHICNQELSRKRIIKEISDALEKEVETAPHFVVHEVKPLGGAIQWGWQCATDNADVFLGALCSRSDQDMLSDGRDAHAQNCGCLVTVIKAAHGGGEMVLETMHITGMDLDCFTDGAFRMQLQEIQEPAKDVEEFHEYTIVTEVLAAPDLWCGHAPNVARLMPISALGAAVGALFIPWSVVTRCRREHSRSKCGNSLTSDMPLLANALKQYCVQHQECHIIVLVQAELSNSDFVKMLGNDIAQFAHIVLSDVSRPVYYYYERPQERRISIDAEPTPPSVSQSSPSAAPVSNAIEIPSPTTSLMAARTAGWILRMHGISFKASAVLTLAEQDDTLQTNSQKMGATGDAGKEGAWIQALQQLVGLRGMSLQVRSHSFVVCFFNGSTIYLGISILCHLYC